MGSFGGQCTLQTLLLSAAAVMQVAAQTACTDESCKVDNTARLTWTLLGVLLIINLLLFCMLTCTWYYLFTRIRDLRRQINFNRPKRGVIDCHVDANRSRFRSAYDHRSSVALEYFPNPDSKHYPLNTFQSPDATWTSQDVRNSQDARDSKEFDDYSSVVDAVPDSPPPQLDGVIRSLRKPPSCRNPSRKSKVSTGSKSSKAVMKKSSSQPHSIHPFYSIHTENSPARKASRDRKRLIQAASGYYTSPTDSQRAKSDSVDHHYSHIVDGFSPVEGESTVFSEGIGQPTSPAAPKKPASASSTSQLEDDSAATQEIVPEKNGYVYSTPHPDGIENLWRLTVRKSRPAHSQEQLLDREDEQPHPVARPKSALGLYPLDISSVNSSPCSTIDGRRPQKKDQKLFRPVSAYYTHPDTNS